MNLVKSSLKVMITTILGIFGSALIVIAVLFILRKVFNASEKVLGVVFLILIIIIILAIIKYTAKIVKEDLEMKPSKKDLIKVHNFNRWVALIIAIFLSLPVLFSLLIFGLRIAGMLLFVLGIPLAFFWWFFYVNNKRYKELTKK